MFTAFEGKALQGVRWTALSSGVIILLQLAHIAVIARFLSAFELGLLGIVNIAAEFCLLFLDMGFSNALIHYQDISRDEQSTLYWLNILAGIALFAAACLASAALAAFYKSQALMLLMITLAVSFLIMPLGHQFQVLLQKELNFKIISAIEIGSRAAGFMSMLLFLFLGHKIYSVVWGMLITTLTSSILFYAFGRKIYKPLFVFQFKKIRKYFNFGLYQMLERALYYFLIQIDSLLIGKLMGIETLGLYMLAKNLVLRPAFLIHPVITRVSFSLMAKMQQDLEIMRDTYLKTVRYLSSVNFFIYAFIAVFSKPIVLILFGARWEAVIPVLRVLAVWAAIRSTGSPLNSLLLARGRADYGFYWTAATFPIIPAFIYLGSSWGIMGVSFFLLSIPIILFAPIWYFLIRPLCGASFGLYVRQLASPALIATAAALPAFIITCAIPRPLAQVFTALLIYTIFSFMLSTRFNKGSLRFLKDLIFAERLNVVQ